MYSHSTQFGRCALSGVILPLLVLFATHLDQARAATAATPPAVYTISDHEGYGVVECLIQKMQCGKIVADSWCEAHGHGPALAYGRADDITASSKGDELPPAPAPDAAIVACKE